VNLSRFRGGVQLKHSQNSELHGPEQEHSKKRLITLEFEMDVEDAGGSFQDIEDLKKYWTDHDVQFRIFRDTARKSRYLGMFLTGKSVDEIVGLIQTDARAKSVFERLKKLGVHIVLSVMEEFE
jgi:hypothetical protein